jgi:hypothetical protein
MRKPFHVLTEVRYKRGRRDEPLIVPVRFAYTDDHGRMWLILEWERQSEWLPSPAKHWTHLDGSPLGEFQAVPADWSGLISAEYVNALLRGEVDQRGVVRKEGVAGDGQDQRGQDPLQT